MGPIYRYRANLVRVIDGDTYVLSIDYGFRQRGMWHIRLRDVNAPEVHGPQRELGLVSKSYVQSVFDNATEIVVETYKDQQTFERWVADVWLDGVSLAETLVGAGMAARVNQ